MPHREPLTADEIAARLAALPEWTREGDALVRVYQIDYDTAAEIIGQVAQISRRVDHHADIDLRYGTLRFAITTHDRGHRITARDFALATLIDATLALPNAALPDTAPTAAALPGDQPPPPTPRRVG
jgi:4a-hydroxytetrahydrobiopterin dehydratase